MTATAVVIDDSEVCRFITNPKDGYPDYPDSVWQGSSIAPVVERLITDPPKSGHQLVFDADSHHVFTNINPILRSILRAENDRLRLASDASTMPEVLLTSFHHPTREDAAGWKYIEIADSFYLYSHFSDYWYQSDEAPMPRTAYIPSKINGAQYATRKQVTLNNRSGFVSSLPLSLANHPQEMKAALHEFFSHPPKATRVILKPNPITSYHLIRSMILGVAAVDTSLVLELSKPD